MWKNIVLIGVFISLSGCSNNNEYNLCLQKGIQYYKDLGSYPRLKSENISAEDKVRENCSRSTVAFD